MKLKYRGELTVSDVKKHIDQFKIVAFEFKHTFEFENCLKYFSN